MRMRQVSSHPPCGKGPGESLRCPACGGTNPGDADEGDDSRSILQSDFGSDENRLVFSVGADAEPVQRDPHLQLEELEGSPRKSGNDSPRRVGRDGRR